MRSFFINGMNPVSLGYTMMSVPVVHQQCITTRDPHLLGDRDQLLDFGSYDLGASEADLLFWKYLATFHTQSFIFIV